jgi:hypothetical protein
MAANRKEERLFEAMWGRVRKLVPAPTDRL